MPEILEEQNSEPLDMQRYLDVARRRYPIFVISAFVGWLIVWGASWILPASYKSSTLILVEQPNMPKDYVVSNINDDLQDRVQNITQQILSRTRLLQIIDQLNLYGGSYGKLTPDDKVARMRKDIVLEVVHDTRNIAVTAFKIEYSAADPHVAQQVTLDLTNLFINENSEERQRQSEDTTKFLETQLEAARQNLAEQDAKIRVFKGAHVGDLPTQQASNLQILAGMQAQLENEQEGLSTARQQQVYLQTLINQYRTLQGPTRTADGAPSGLPAIDKELASLKAQLADLSSQYTDQYPDVLKLKTQIAKTEKIRSQLIADLKSQSDGSSQADSAPVARDLGDPTQASPILQLQGQLQANKTEIANREQAIAALKAKVGEYQGRLNDEPVREQQLADLTRGYDQSRANYDELLKKENESKMATSMEKMQKGERFRMIDPPSLPLKPDFPDRLKFCAFGLAFGLGLGAVVVGGFEFMDDRLHTEKGIKALLPTKVLFEIPEVLTPWDELKRRNRMLMRWGMTVLVFAAILVGSAFSYLHN
jgi:polysaccharide chain length determinant protein (PEP-CTERM system associated)